MDHYNIYNNYVFCHIFIITNYFFDIKYLLMIIGSLINLYYRKKELNTNILETDKMEVHNIIILF